MTEDRRRRTEDGGQKTEGGRPEGANSEDLRCATKIQKALWVTQGLYQVTVKATASKVPDWFPKEPKYPPCGEYRLNIL